MDQTEFYRQVKVGALNTRLKNAEIDVAMGLGLTALNHHFQQYAPEYLNDRAVVQSDGIVFERPSRCMKIKGVWDLNQNAITITDVAVNSGIPTFTATGFTPVDGEVVGINALTDIGFVNGYYRISTSDDTTFTADGVSGCTDTWSSGGLVWRETDQPPTTLDPIDVDDADGSHPTRYYIQQLKLVVDDHEFENDILIDFEKSFTALTDIEEQHHITLVSFCVLHLAQPPAQDAPLFRSYQKNQDFYNGLWQSGLGIIEDISAVHRPKFNHRPIQDF